MEQYTVIVYKEKTEWLNSDGKLYRLDGPARECSDGSKYWYLNGNLHRTDGPAYEKSNGHKEWWLNNEKHRVDGPAIEYPNGSKEWWLNNKKHRINGPAVECADGNKEWYINGIKYTEEDFNKKISLKHTITIDDKKIELSDACFEVLKSLFN